MSDLLVFKLACFLGGQVGNGWPLRRQISSIITHAGV